MAVQRIQLRRGTAAEWFSANPVLASGEPGYETDTGAWKLGNGSTAWNSLAYQVLGSAANVRMLPVWDGTGAHPARPTLPAGFFVIWRQPQFPLAGVIGGVQYSQPGDEFEAT